MAWCERSSRGSGSTLWRTGANALVSALFAPVCAVCDAVLDDPLDGCVCQRCWGSVLRITSPVCRFCGDPLPRCSSTCPRCAAREHVVDRARAVGEYEGALREIVHALKYGGRQSLARPLARMMVGVGEDILMSTHFLVPVPLHWRREYQRGFNQARELARYLGVPIVEALTRVRATRAQVELAAETRRQNVQGVFRCRTWSADGDVAGMKLALIDDVRTTGSTLDECARVLKSAGVAEVYALTAARVSTRPSVRPIDDSRITTHESRSHHAAFTRERS